MTRNVARIGMNFVVAAVPAPAALLQEPQAPRPGVWGFPRAIASTMNRHTIFLAIALIWTAGWVVTVLVVVLR